MTLAADISPAGPAAIEPPQPRARGMAMLSAQASPRGTVIDDLHQSGSMKLLFPRGADDELQAVLLNTAGGITGGDRFEIGARALPDSRLTLSTQAAERAYRARPGEVARLSTRLVVDAGARANWLPQETILYDGCALDRRLTAELAADATLLLAEPLVFGRAAMGEVLATGLFRDRIEIRRDGVPVFLDAFRLEGAISAHLARPHVAAGMGAMATLVLAAPAAAGHLDALRALMPATGGASLLADDLLVCRLLAPDSHLLRQSLVPALERLTGTALPKVWMI